jgi:hypothetical protein
VLIDELRTERPGYIVFEDEHQVVALRRNAPLDPMKHPFGYRISFRVRHPTMAVSELAKCLPIALAGW